MIFHRLAAAITGFTRLPGLAECFAGGSTRREVRLRPGQNLILRKTAPVSLLPPAYGDWQRMFAGHPKAVKHPIQCSASTARCLMIIAQHPGLKRDHGHVLPPSWRTLYELTKVPHVSNSVAAHGLPLRPSRCHSSRSSALCVSHNFLSSSRPAGEDSVKGRVHFSPMSRQSPFGGTHSPVNNKYFSLWSSGCFVGRTFHGLRGMLSPLVASWNSRILGSLQVQSELTHTPEIQDPILPECPQRRVRDAPPVTVRGVPPFGPEGLLVGGDLILEPAEHGEPSRIVEADEFALGVGLVPVLFPRRPETARGFPPIGRAHPSPPEPCRQSEDTGHELPPINPGVQAPIIPRPPKEKPIQIGYDA